MLHVGAGTDLRRLTRTWRRYDAVVVSSSRLSPSDRTRWERRLFAHYSDCGCDVGGLAVLMALATTGVLGALGALAGTPTNVLLALGACLAAAVVGKAFGLAIARLRLAWDARVLSRRLEGQPQALTATRPGTPTRALGP